LKNIAQIENPTEKREMLETALSNSPVSGKSVDLQWVLPLRMMIDMGGSLGVRRVGTNLEHGSTTSQERQERFLKALDERSDELYKAIVNEERLRRWPTNSDDFSLPSP
jgi:hypothetical protein